MRLALHERGGIPVPAMLVRPGNRELVLDLAPGLRAIGFDQLTTGSLVEVLANWPALAKPLGELARKFAVDPDASWAAGAVTDVADVHWLPPVGPGQLIVCCGFNYASHEAEVGGSSVGATWFIKNSNSVTAACTDILLPPDKPETIDYEGELAVVIGRYCHRVTAEDALDYVAGYTLVNDVSARLEPHQEDSADDIRRAVINTHFGKQYPTFCPIGPTVVTADEIPDPSLLSFTTAVNGVVMQKAELRDMRLSVANLISWLSIVFAFRPGDVISTGSPSGSGVSHNPPRFLRNGDVVTVAAPEIGELTNRVTSRQP